MTFRLIGFGLRELLKCNRQKLQRIDPLAIISFSTRPKRFTYNTVEEFSDEEHDPVGGKDLKEDGGD